MSPQGRRGGPRKYFYRKSFLQKLHKILDEECFVFLLLISKIIDKIIKMTGFLFWLQK